MTRETEKDNRGEPEKRKNAAAERDGDRERGHSPIEDFGQLRDRVSESFLGSISRDKDESVLADLKTRLILSLIFVVPLLLGTLLGRQESFNMLLFQIAVLIPLIVVNHRVFIDGAAAIRRGNPEKNTLAAIASLMAILILQLETAGVVLSTMAVCRYCEAYIRLRLRTHLSDLIEGKPDDRDVEEGQLVTIEGGDVIPADGIIHRGEGSLNEQLITGERVLRKRKKGDVVFAGTVNAGEPLEIRITRTGQDRVIEQIIQHMGRAMVTKAPMARRAEKAARWFVIIAIAAAVIAGLVWGSLPGDFMAGVTTAISVLIIASPYAFSASVPMVIQAAVVLGASQGILIRDAKVLEDTRDLNTVVMNKTGTITAGLPEISDVIPVRGDFDLRLAGILEKGSDHPIGKKIFQEAERQYGELRAAEMVNSSSGLGLIRSLEGKTWYIGNSEHMRRHHVSIEADRVEELFRQGKSLIFFAEETELAGIIALRDAPAPASLKAITQIEEMGIDVVMVTGDARETAEAIRYEVGIDHIFALVRPGERKRVVEQIQNDKKCRVAMIGDGVKDAPAIKAADLGIAIGSGKDIYIGPADIVLISEDLLDVVRAIRLSRITNRVLRQSMALAYVYNIAAILAAGFLAPFAGLFLAPVAAALCMCASQILIVLNPIRIRKREL